MAESITTSGGGAHFEAESVGRLNQVALGLAAAAIGTALGAMAVDFETWMSASVDVEVLSTLSVMLAAALVYLSLIHI